MDTCQLTPVCVNTCLPVRGPSVRTLNMLSDYFTGWLTGVRFPAREIDFYLGHHGVFASEASPISCPLGNWITFAGEKVGGV